jgi:hypothetical protein
MTRLILTFPTLFKVLAADKLLQGKVHCRTTPTPAGLSADICGVAIELLNRGQQDSALDLLRNNDLPPAGIHEVN